MTNPRNEKNPPGKGVPGGFWRRIERLRRRRRRKPAPFDLFIW
jgi:hypothetical protein